MTITLEAVNELIQSLESAGEPSIREQKFLKLAKAYQQLAAENVALKAVFSQKEIPSEAVDAFMETAVMDHDWNETSEWSWVENKTEVIHAVLNALKPETPVTDAYLAGIKADAAAPLVSALKVIANSEQHNGDTVVCDFDTLISVAAGALRDYYAKQLREGADK